MGYSYRLKEKLSPEECIRKMKIVDCQGDKLNKTELLELIADCCNSPLPRNESVLWEILVGSQPIKWTPNRLKTYHPILFRVHHGVADGVSLLKLLTGVFADSPQMEIVSSRDYKEITVSKSVELKNKSSLHLWTEASLVVIRRGRYILEQIFTAIHILAMYPAVCYTQIMLKCNDSNILHGPPLTGQKVLALSIEEKPEYVQKIKRMKNKVTGTCFSDFLLTAFSESLCDYYAKKSDQRPTHISSLVPVLPGALELKYMVPGQLNENNISFKNGYSFVLPSLPLFIPINPSEKQSPLLNRLQWIKNEMDIYKTSIDFKLNYILMCVLGGVVPQPTIRRVLKNSHCTTLISILAGPQDMTFGGGLYLLESLAYWVPHVKNIGVSFSVLTYRNRLHIGLSADKALISNQGEAQSIVDGVFKYLDDIENEINAIENIEKG